MLPTELEQDIITAQVGLKQLARQSGITYLDIGELACEVKENPTYWSAAGSLKQFFEDLELGMSYSQITRLIGYHEVLVKKMGLPKASLAELGTTKLPLILPLARRDELTTEIWDMAHMLSATDLKRELGYKVPSNRMEESVTCPRCGEEIRGARYAGKKEE